LSFEEILRGDGYFFIFFVKMCVSASSVSLSWSHSRKAAAPMILFRGGSNSLFLFCYFFLFVWLSLASLLWCVPLGVWLEFVVGFRLSFSFIHRKEGCVCVLTWGWNEDGEPPPSCEVGPSFRMMALLLLVLGVGFGGGSLPPFLR
jgi:hypothetical protein